MPKGDSYREHCGVPYNSSGDDETSSYGYHRSSSQVSFGVGESAAPSEIITDFANYLPASQRTKEPYPDWRSEDNVPISKEEIEEIFLHLTTKFWFQQDSMTDMYDHFLTLLDSRASRMPLALAFISLHANYIGEDNANYRKWYFAVGLELENDGLMGSSKSGVKGKQGASKNKKGNDLEDTTIPS